MSNISNRHNVNLFESGKSQPLTGQRLAKIGYKASKGKNAKFPSVCVSVPQIDPIPMDEPAYQESFKSILRAALESAQDGIIRNLYESSAGQLKSVGDEEISIPACLAWIESENSGGRLTEEFLKSWFNQNVQDNLAVVIMTKLGFEEVPEDTTAIDRHVNGYRDLFASLSGTRTSLSPGQILNLRKVLELVQEDSTGTVERLEKKLDDMEKKSQKIVDLLAL